MGKKQTADIYLHGSENNQIFFYIYIIYLTNFKYWGILMKY